MKPGFDIEDYIAIAERTQAFHTGDLETLREVLDDLSRNSRTSYHIFEQCLDGVLTGFVLFGRTPLTAFSWDIYWLVVEKSAQGKGIGKKLLQQADEFIAGRMLPAVIRLETSTRKEYSAARGLYKKVGFVELGNLPNFYGPDDNLLIFYKELKKNDQGTAAG